MRSLHLLSLCVSIASADFLLGRFPAPTDLSSEESLVAASWKNVTSILDEYLNGNQNSTSEAIASVKNTTFSFGMFSVHDSATSKSLQYHYTASNLNPNGTSKVDGDTIYRVASVTKLFTVLVGMVDLSPEQWNLPLTAVIPGLAEFYQGLSGDKAEIYISQWDKITPWALAAQIAGVARQGVPGLDLLYQYLLAQTIGDNTIPDPTTQGLPPLNGSELGPCAQSTQIFCTPNEFVGSVQDQAPTFLPWTSPAYANNGFMLLGIALLNITGKKDFDALYNDAVISPLEMTSTNISTPPQSLWSRSAIVGADPRAYFAIDGGYTKSSGGIFSTINDLAKFGVGILNHTLLSPEVTHKWMKPISHTSSLTYSIGAPWEIIRYVHENTGRITDVYTKLGDSGAYGGYIILIPEYDAGFSYLAANVNETQRGDDANIVMDLVFKQMMPALEAQAAKDAGKKFAGHYECNSGLNSSLIVTLNETAGLTISSWISNGTDMLQEFLPGKTARLFPSITDQGDGKVAFRESSQVQTSSYTAAGVGPFTGDYVTNFDWLSVDSFHYGNMGFDLFVFDVDKDGVATSVNPAITRVTLQRKDVT